MNGPRILVDPCEAELTDAYVALHDLAQVVAEHFDSRRCRQVMVRHAETLVKAKGAVNG